MNCIIWLDDSPDGVDWVQAEFDALWAHPAARPLAETVIADIARLSRRTTFASVPAWREQRPNQNLLRRLWSCRSIARENGLWAHQKFFVRLAFDAHQNGGARYVLADQVGLGKTVQLGLSAKLMALTGSLPILIAVPKTLMEQWQDELWNLLALPSARWTGRLWIDERGVEHAGPGTRMDRLGCSAPRWNSCSSGLITSGSIAAQKLLGLKYDCVIVDEAHRARRNSGKNKTVTVITT